MKSDRYIRKSFGVDAVQVTEANFAEVAAWCGGFPMNDGTRKYIQVDVKHPINPRQTRAYVGDWVLSSDKGYKVFTDSAFKKQFVPDTTEAEDEFGLDTEGEEAVGRLLNVFQYSDSAEIRIAAVDPKDQINGKRN